MTSSFPNADRIAGAKFRPSRTEPGEHLISPPAPIPRYLRGQQFVAEMRLTPSQVVDSQLVALPIPSYDAEVPAGTHRFADVDPAKIWHPFFWLPERLHERFDDATDDGTVELESNDAWALRVMWEMAAAGLYNVETGEWVDVLSLHGIDIDQRENWVRVAEWLLGVPDDELDAIDLDDYLRVDDEPYWSIEAAATLEDPVRHTMWARTANTMIEWAYEVEDDFGQEADFPALRQELRAILRVGSIFLSGANSAGIGAHGEVGPDTFWAGTLDEIASTADAELLSVLNDQITVHADRILARHWDEMQEFWASYAAGLAAAS